MANSTISGLPVQSGTGNDNIKGNDLVMVDRGNQSYKAKIAGKRMVPAVDTTDAGKILTVNSSGVPEFATAGTGPVSATIEILWKRASFHTNHTPVKDTAYTLQDSRRFSSYKGVSFVSYGGLDSNSPQKPKYIYFTPFYAIGPMRSFFSTRISSDTGSGLEFKWNNGDIQAGTLKVISDTQWMFAGNNGQYVWFWMIIGQR